MYNFKYSQTINLNEDQINTYVTLHRRYQSILVQVVSIYDIWYLLFFWGNQ